MGKMRFEVSHTLNKEDARARVEKLFRYWANKYGAQATWNGHRATLSGKVMGLSIDADVEIQESRVAADATDPGFLFREKAKKYLTEKFNHYLDPKTQLTALAEK